MTLTRTGDTASALTALIRVDDPSGFLRGNHWDSPPQLPTQLEFQAGSSTAVLSVDVQDDRREIEDAAVTVYVEPSGDYLLGHAGLETKDEFTVTDNDTRHRIELHFGKDGTNHEDADEGDTLKFLVKRRASDAGDTRGIVVRVETNRSGADPVLDGWTEDPGTGRTFMDYAVTLTDSQDEAEQAITVTKNGLAESNWRYWASILPMEDLDGNQLSPDLELQYWRVRSTYRNSVIDATDTGTTTGNVKLQADRTTVHEGDEVTYTLTRQSGPMGNTITVRVQTLEYNRQVGFGVNPSSRNHHVTFGPWESVQTFAINAYVDGVTESATDTLYAEIKAITGSGYQTGNPYTASVEIDDPPSGTDLVSLSASPSSIAEGGTATFTLTRAGGDTAQPLTVDIRVDDPQDFLRGNHWDSAPSMPSQVVFPANSTTQTLSLTAPDDQRDLPNGSISVTVLPATGYLPGNVGLSTTATVSVTDNDDAQELTFDWGWLDLYDSSWLDGESYLSCNSTPCTSGPAEGLYYYEDNRTFQFSDELESYWPAHFQVTRREEDTGQTATFTVRVEHDRGWASPRHAHWPVDPVTGKHYFDFPLTLTENQRTVVGRIEILDNGRPSLWNFSARILPVTDSTTRSEVTADIEADYWTVSGQREKSHRVTDAKSLELYLEDPVPNPVAEGDQVEFSVNRKRGYALEPLTIQVRTWEPNQRAADGANPTERVHSVVFPAMPMTSEFIQSYLIDQTMSFTVTTTQDTIYELSDVIRAEILPIEEELAVFHGTVRADILDDDQPTISLEASDTSITEGSPVTFTLTRGVNTAEGLIVSVSVDDPGGFLMGNFPSAAVTVPSSIVFAPGDVTASVTVTPPDDWRDIPDSTLTFAVLPEPEYEIVAGFGEVTVNVADNDIAPQVGISFNHAEVDEGEDLILTIQRIGDARNPLDISLTLGPVDSQSNRVIGMDPGQSELIYTYNLPDDEFKGLDTHYEVTLHPEDPEFWVPTGPTTITGTILDNDPYRVGIRAITAEVDEGQILYYQVFHDGHTAESLQVKVSHSENGSAVADSLLGPLTHTIHVGASGNTRGYVAQANDGSDGDALFTIELVTSDDYEIDPNHASASITVRDKDPLPVVELPTSAEYVDEGDGNLEIRVDLTSNLPVLRTVTADYQVVEGAYTDGIDITESSGTIEFPPGATQVVVEVPVVQDNTAEANEPFNVFLSNPMYATLQDGQATLRFRAIIVDDENTVSMEAAQAAVTEGTDAVFNLTREGNSSDELTVWLRLIQSAPKSSISVEEAIFPAGKATTQLAIPTLDDEARQGSYTVTAQLEYPPALGKPRAYHRQGSLSESITVRDDEFQSISLYVEDFRVVEGQPVKFTVSRRDKQLS